MRSAVERPKPPALGRVEKAGGKVTMPKTGIGPNGFMAFFVDTEGNQMAMHSNA